MRPCYVYGLDSAHDEYSYRACAIFHEWSTELENLSVQLYAIVELDSDDIALVHASQIKFVDHDKLMSKLWGKME